MYIRNREAERLNYYRIPNPRIEDLQHGCYNIRAQIWNGGKSPFRGLVPVTDGGWRY